MTNTPSRIQHQPKVLATYNKLLDIIKGLEADAKLPTAVALRTQMGVSSETLNQAFRELEQQHLIYSVRGVGIYVSPRRRTCLLIDPLFFHSQDVSPFWRLLVKLIRRSAAIKNEDFSFYFAHPTGFKDEILPLDVQQQIEVGDMAGVLGVGISNEVYDWLEERTSVVVFAAYGKYDVKLDAAAAISNAAGELARQGCQDIGFWKPHHAYRDLQGDRDQEVDVFTTALHSLKREFTPSLTRCLSSTMSSNDITNHQDQGYRTAYEVFDKKGRKRPDGIFIGDDMMALGALKALKEMGVRVGEDVLIASASNKGADVLPVDENILVFEFDLEEIVHAMFSLLDERLQGQTPFSRTVEVRAKMRTQTRAEDARK